MVNKRISWAERRLTRTRSRSDSLSRLTGALDHDNSEMGFQYEEFMKDSVPCPSCGGGGRIDRESESKLVALIPYDDDRLKPRRTWFYVGAAVAVSVLLAGATLFFLFPRAVKISSEKKRLQPIHLEIDDEGPSPSVFLVIQQEFTVENSNYVPVTFESITMRSTVFEQTLNVSTNATQVTVPLRSSLPVYASAAVHFQNALGFIAPYCKDPRKYLHTLLFHFDVAAQASILSHSQDMSMSFFQHVSCGIDVNSDQEEGGNQGENSLLEETKTVMEETKTAMEETKTGSEETKTAMEETKSVMDSLDFDTEDSS